MPHSLKARLGNLRYKKVISDKDYDRLCKALEQESKWIPVTERLPEDGERAIFTDGKCMSIERYKMDALDHFYPSGRYFNLEDAVAWMPLPEPYNEKESENERKTES